MKLEDFGYNEEIEKIRIENNCKDFEIGRVIAEHRERYMVKSEKGEIEAEITGNLRFSAEGHEDFPTVGDWVALTIYGDDFSIIHKVLPRFSLISRRASGEFGQKQIIAANVDFALLIQAIDGDFNINRLERYLTICYSSKVNPIIVLTKIDLLNGQTVDDIIESIKKRITNAPVIALSNKNKEGYDAIENIIVKGKTYCMLGSSGVGKSTLLNNLLGREKMKTESISKSTSKGRHTTTHRELIVLDNGGIIIDNPGIREVGIVDSNGGLENTFDKIFALSLNCRYRDCTHTNEIGCSVLEAVEKGEIDNDSYISYMKIKREKEFFESSVAERRKKDKDFGKMLKNYKKEFHNAN